MSVVLLCRLFHLFQEYLCWLERGYLVGGDDYSGVLYKFKSDNLWTDPYPILQQGSQVRVLVNGTDYSQYHVDVENCLQGKVVDYT